MPQAHDVENRLKKVIISPQTPIAAAIPVLDRAGMGILLICDDDRKLLGVMTDGDIRRAILRGVSFTQSCLTIASHDPVTAPAGISPSEALYLMYHNGRGRAVNHLPVVDRDGKVADLLWMRDLVVDEQPFLSAVVMAGGQGIRLRPLTEDIPKPMLPVGDRPLLALIIEQLRAAGIRQVNLTTHYKPEKISEYFGDGRQFGVEINYVNEDRPLGTAGALGLLETSAEPLLVINGDILTHVDFRTMLAYHRKHGADLTVGVRRYEFQVPYGVLECEGSRVLRVQEKPTYGFLLNAGIYILEPEIRQFIPTGEKFDMTDLISALLVAKRPVVSFPVVEYWLDIGRLDDYKQAQEDACNGKIHPPQMPSGECEH